MLAVCSSVCFFFAGSDFAVQEYFSEIAQPHLPKKIIGEVKSNLRHAEINVRFT